jgi:hypothetical protein
MSSYGDLFHCCPRGRLRMSHASDAYRPATPGMQTGPSARNAKPYRGEKLCLFNCVAPHADRRDPP